MRISVVPRRVAIEAQFLGPLHQVREFLVADSRPVRGSYSGNRSLGKRTDVDNGGSRNASQRGVCGVRVLEPSAELLHTEVVPVPHQCGVARRIDVRLYVMNGSPRQR